MASTAATGVFCRPGRMSLRAVLSGFFDCAHVVCAIADAARNSKAGIRKVLSILSSFQFGFQLAFSKRMLCHCYVRPGVYSLRQESDCDSVLRLEPRGPTHTRESDTTLAPAAAVRKSCNNAVIVPLSS